MLKRLAWTAATAFVTWTLVACGASNGGTATDTVATDTSGDATADDINAADATADAVADGIGDTTPSVDTAIPVGDPITAPDETWTFVPLDGATCDDGSATGVGVNLNPGGRDLMVFIEGGGACWSYLTCIVLHTAAQGPFGASDLAGMASRLENGIFDRADGTNPFKGYSFVYVPYCTGDLHSGSRVVTYDDGNGTTADYHHTGHANIVAALSRLRGTFATVDHLAVIGESAGGYGTLFNYASIRDALAPADSIMVDDSGPAFIGDAIRADLRTQWLGAWRPTDILADVCADVDCGADLSLVYTQLATRFSSDRLSLLSSLQDQTIRTYFGFDGPTFEANLRALASDVITPQANMRVFFKTGSSHTMVKNPSTSAGLWTFIDAQVSGSGWESVIP